MCREHIIALIVKIVLKYTHFNQCATTLSFSLYTNEEKIQIVHHLFLTDRKSVV